jgi:hypothetical protein
MNKFKIFFNDHLKNYLKLDMYNIDMQEMSDEFKNCWASAGNHINQQTDTNILSWLRAHPYPPFLEHLSFRIGNQLFFIRVEDIDEKIKGPGNISGLLEISQSANGKACLMPMKKSQTSKKWNTLIAGWGLIDAKSGGVFNPLDFVSSKKIAMTEWEIQDMAVQVVRDYLKNKNYKLMSWQGNPHVDPSIWFVGDTGGPEWVIVRATRYPQKYAAIPDNISKIKKSCESISANGHFASISMANAEQSNSQNIVPLWRGEGINIHFTGLDPIISRPN